jgi:hypothetical protein
VLQSHRKLIRRVLVFASTSLCALTTETARAAASTPRASARARQTPRPWTYGYVSANVTVKTNEGSVRAIVVSEVFPYCWGEHKEAAILEDASLQVGRAIRAKYADAPYEITYQFVDSYSMRELADKGRQRALSGPFFRDHLTASYQFAGYSNQCR